MGTDENIADALTKVVNRDTLEYHVEHTFAECRRDRHRLAPEVIADEMEKKEEGGTYEEESPAQGQCLESRAAEENESWKEE